MKPAMVPSLPDIDALRERLLAGDRAALARAITLAESRRADHRAAVRDLIDAVLPETGKAIRVGITGVPGVGKSTTIDTLGSQLTRAGHKVAVLAVDPSSTRTGGSILGDKTRMAQLAQDRNAFIRPSPSSGTLGGVAAKTRETMLLCEAAGFDVILVETVGVGQSETAVADLTDFFLVLMLPGAGDELQGIKKGILELADMIAVNKADDGEGEKRARAAASDYRAALHILTPASATWTPPVITISGLHGKGLDDLWAKIEDHRRRLTATGEIAERRRRQDVKWMWALVHERLHQKLTGSAEVRKATAEAEKSVATGEHSPAAGAQAISELIGL
ncbi:putative GTPase [Methylobacterium gnaphalii]|nr:putative GTPase [Methylobacterium gnaphalii]